MNRLPFTKYASKALNEEMCIRDSVYVDDIFSIPVSHGEGRFVADEDVIQKLFENGQVATQYVDLNGDPTMNEEFNPNGSYHAIEGITSPDGRVLGKMGHSERRDSYVGIDVYKRQAERSFAGSRQNLRI